MVIMLRRFFVLTLIDDVVRLGNSGLKVSKIILGTMQYGSPEWQKWVLGEKEGIEHIKAAWVIDVGQSWSWSHTNYVYQLRRRHPVVRYRLVVVGIACRTVMMVGLHAANVYSNGERYLSGFYFNFTGGKTDHAPLPTCYNSEIILGKAIKQHNLPRDEIVVMTKVRYRPRPCASDHQIHFPQWYDFLGL